jgi:hypothetical protein
VDLDRTAEPHPRSDRSRQPAAGSRQPAATASSGFCDRQSIPFLADRAYTGADPWVTTGLRSPLGGELTPTQRTLNRAIALARAPLERGMARLQSWQIFRRSRISPNRMTVITRAVLTLERQR